MKYDVQANYEGKISIGTGEIGEYIAQLTGYSGGYIDIFRDILVHDNFTVISNDPSVGWISPVYYLDEIMTLKIYVPSGSQVVTVYYPNNTVLYNSSYSASGTLYNRTFNTRISQNLTMPVGRYRAVITGGNVVYTELLNISVSDYRLKAPASVTYGDKFNIEYLSPKESILYMTDSLGNISINEPVSGEGIRSFNTYKLGNKETVLTIKLIRGGVEMKNTTVALKQTSGAVGGYLPDESDGDLMYNLKTVIYSMFGRSAGTLFIIGMVIVAICAFVLFAIIKHPLGGAFGGLVGLGISVTAEFIPLVWGVIILVLAGFSFMGLMKKG